MTRTYLFLREGMPRALAALALTALVAGCGSSGRSNTTTVAAAPTGVSSGAEAAGGAVGAQVADQPSGTTAAAGKIIQHQAPQLTSGHSHSLAVASVAIHQATGAQVTSGTASESLMSSAANGAVQAPGSSTGASASTPSTVPSTSAVAPTRTATTTTPAATTTTHPQSSAPPRTIVRVVVRTRTKTNTVTRVHMVTKTVRPDVPSTAFLPSTHPALAVTSFTVAAGNIGCRLEFGQVRCSIQRRVWAAPVQPSACTTSWGDTISLQSHGAAKFVCGGRSAIAPNAKLIPNGWDDTLGSLTCQVRGVGVDCFSKTHHGFIISRTGYATY